MEATEDYQIEALSEDVNIEELLTIFSFKRTVDDVWTIPTSLSANDLQGYVSVMNECLKTTIAGKKRKDGGETKRKRRVKGKETEFDVKKIVSEQVCFFRVKPFGLDIHYNAWAQFIEDSDEDGADDAAFFAAEAERRKKWSLINSGNYEKEVPAPKSSAKEVVEGNAEDLLVSKDAATVPPQEDNPSDGIESSSESSNGGSSEEEEEDAMSTDGDADVEKKKPRLIISSPASDKAATDA